MIEELIAINMLMCTGLADKNEFSEQLDKRFLGCRENDIDYKILLELECANNISEINDVTSDYMYKNIQNFDKIKYGKALMNRIRDIYYESTDFEKFTDRIYHFWQSLRPTDLKFEEPFIILSYADDPLSWGDEQQSRKLYESALNYYD